MYFNKMNNKTLPKTVLALVLFGLCIVWASQEAYAIRVSLKRIVLEGSKRSEILTIINNSSKPETYRLQWLRFRMENGESSLTQLDENAKADDIKWADDMIRFAPRRVTIPPGGSQQVRLLLRRPKDLQEGEYRAHMQIVTEVEAQPYEEDPNPTKPSIQLTVQPAISLPVFVRHGKLSAEANITNAKLFKTEKGLKVTLTLNRTGNRSVYGDFDFICSDGGENKILREINGIAVYPETTHRDLTFNLELSDTTVANCSNVDVIYRADPDDSQYSGKVLAQATASL